MNKKLSAIVIATLLPAVLFTACKQNNIPDSPSETVNKITTEKVTVSETTQESTEKTTVSTTTLPTDPVSDPTRASTTSVPDVFINFLYKPEKIIFYHNSKPQTLICTPKVRHFWRCIFLWERKEENNKNIVQNSK